jgi:4-alpha-glucanotransferase
MSAVRDDIFAIKRAGIVLHPSSLPGPGTHGTLGREAYRFVDFLSDCGMTVWQTLPLGPTHTDLSPYNCLSAFAGNPDFIDIDLLEQDEWFKAGMASEQNRLQLEQIRGDAAERNHLFEMLLTLFRHNATPAEQQEFERFVADEKYWLQAYACFIALREHFSCLPWKSWPTEYRENAGYAMKQVTQTHADAVQRVQFEEYLFQKQWLRLKRYANEKNILLFGDMPMFVAYDSAEVWSHRELFTLDEHGEQITVAGVPPDYFSETGQRWGNPLYEWDAMKSNNYEWWRLRIKRQLDLYDLIRIDHFRGFEAYWEIPATSKTALDGHWCKAPGEELFASLQSRFTHLPVVAEDLGYITPEVTQLRKHFGMPGMKVLQFAFDGTEDNPHLPANYAPDYIAYTGTHDNNTTVGWFDELDANMKAFVLTKLEHNEEAMPWPMIQTVMASKATIAMLPLQDLLGLGGEHRMNTPGTIEGNWLWRFRWDQIDPNVSEKISAIVSENKRLALDEDV